MPVYWAKSNIWRAEGRKQIAEGLKLFAFCSYRVFLTDLWLKIPHCFDYQIFVRINMLYSAHGTYTESSRQSKG
jgi:hypothetical protein